MKKSLSWLLSIVAEHTLLKLVSSIPIAYFLGWATAACNGAKVMFNNIPPLFWPILAGLVLVVTFYPAYVAPVIKQRKHREKILRASIESAYVKFRNACEPKTLNPASPGNPNFMEADARDYANMIRPLLKDANLNPPEICITTPVSLNEWFRYLEEVRAMDRWIDLTYQAGGPIAS